MSTDNTSPDQETDDDSTATATTTSSPETSISAFECTSCGAPLERTSAHSSINRSLTAGVCGQCGFGAAALLTQDGALSERCKSQLQNRRETAAFGLSVERVAAFITEGCPNGDYTIQRRDDHRYEIELPDKTLDSQIHPLVDRISQEIDHLDVVSDGRRLVLTDTRLLDEPDGKAVADGGVDIRSGVLHHRGPQPLPPITDDDPPRAVRAKTEDMAVSLKESGGIYEVDSQSGNTYTVDLIESHCSCPDTADKCKHIRRVAIAINTYRVPQPDGSLPQVPSPKHLP